MFKIGKEYNRKADIHNKYSGQQQGGISTPKGSPFIFLFTSEIGERHGYKDEYRDDGMFWYTGEGQVGDMGMEGGNRAILDHAKNGKAILLFEYTRTAHVRYIGTAECLGYHEETRPDREGDYRTALVFHLDVNSVPDASHITESSGSLKTKNIKSLKGLRSLKKLRAAALTQGKNRATSKEKRALTYYRSEALKAYVVVRSGGKCEGCECQAPFSTKKGPYLECHHVHRLSDGGPDHPQNVVALCPNCHRRAHYAKDAVSYNKKLKAAALKVEQSTV